MNKQRTRVSNDILFAMYGLTVHTQSFSHAMQDQWRDQSTIGTVRRGGGVSPSSETSAPISETTFG